MVYESSETYSIPTIINRQISREKISYKSKNSLPGRWQETFCEWVQWKNCVNNQGQSGYSRRRPRVPRIGNYLSSKFEVSGFFKPGAGFEKTVGKSIMGSSRLTNKMFLCAMVVLMMSTTITQNR
jgi:hypothetical protein